MPERDILKLHGVGFFAVISGLLLLGLTTVRTLIAGLAGESFNLDNFIRSALNFGLALVVSAALTGYGLQFMRLKSYALRRRELRLMWTALVILMTLCGIAGTILNSPVAALAGLMLVLLFAVRGAVIRLTNP
jgi:uncharacterized membrane protein